jgi:hypothetical protein
MDLIEWNDLELQKDDISAVKEPASNTQVFGP